MKEQTIYIPTPISQKPEKTDWYIVEASGSYSEYLFDGEWVAPKVGMDDPTNWLRPTTLPQELAAKDKEIAEQKEKVAGLLKVLKGFVDGYDHDQDAHKYDNLPACIKCYSQKMIEKYS